MRPDTRTNGSAILRSCPGRIADGTKAIVENRSSVWRGLLWCEWFAHSKLVLFFLLVWLGCVWALPLFAHPGWILLLGGAYALLAGPAFGGGDVIEGCEEFSFSLPATRMERYLARLALGAGSLLLFTALDFLALGLDVSQALARLYIDSGLIKPLQVSQPGLLYGLLFAVPFAIFAFSFVCATVTHSRLVVLTAWFWGGLAALVALRGGLQYEQLVWNKANGVVACPLLILLGMLALVAGCRYYCCKEVGAVAAPLHIPSRWWAWIAIFAAGVALALLLVNWLVRQAPSLLGVP